MKKISHSNLSAWLVRILPAIYMLLFMAACEKERYAAGEEQTAIIFTIEGAGPESRSLPPQEDLLTDINLFLFNEAEKLEHSLYLKKDMLGKSETGYTCDIALLKNCRYSVYVCANAGSRMPVDNIKDLLSYRYPFLYAEDYRIGVPMTGCVRNVQFTGQKEIRVPLERTMAKVSISIDRSRLYNDVMFHVNRVHAGGTPRRVLLFGDSKAEDPYDTFPVGFSKEGYEVENLNIDTGNRKSKELSLYMLENMQGDLLHGAASYKDKFFEKGDPRAGMCSYVEIFIDYLSPTFCTVPGESLVYRFYLGDNERNFDVKRNVHYHITVIPEGDGLQGDGWRVDKSAIEET